MQLSETTDAWEIVDRSRHVGAAVWRYLTRWLLALAAGKSSVLVTCEQQLPLQQLQQFSLPQQVQQHPPPLQFFQGAGVGFQQQWPRPPPPSARPPTKPATFQPVW